MKKAKGISKRQPDRRDDRRRAAIEHGRALPPASPHLTAMIPNLEQTPEWQEAISSPSFDAWRNSLVDVQRVQGAIATKIIRKLRDENVRILIASGQRFWSELALNVISSNNRWHQSGRIQASAMRSVANRLSNTELADAERRTLTNSINTALLTKIDTGSGEEFRALAGVARRTATNELTAGLEERIRNSPQRSVRTNAQRLLDYINGKPYRRYYDSL